VESLVLSGANMNIQNKFGRTVLILRAYNGHFESVKVLVESGDGYQCPNTSYDRALL